MGDDSWLRVESPRKASVALATVASTVTAIVVCFGAAILVPVEQPAPAASPTPSPCRNIGREIAEVDSALALGERTLDDLAKTAAMRWYWDSTLISVRREIHEAMDENMKKRAQLERERGQ